MLILIKVASVQAAWMALKSTIAHASDEHLILRDGAAAFRSATIAASAISDQELETSGEALHETGKLPHRRDHGLVHHVGSFLNPIERAGEHFVGSNDLQPCSISRVVYDGIHTLHFGANGGGRLLQI